MTNLNPKPNLDYSLFKRHIDIKMTFRRQGGPTADKVNEGKNSLRSLLLFVYLGEYEIFVVMSAASIKQDAVGDGRFRPRCHHLANWTKHTRRL